MHDQRQVLVIGAVREMLHNRITNTITPQAGTLSHVTPGLQNIAADICSSCCALMLTKKPSRQTGDDVVELMSSCVVNLTLSYAACG